MTEAAESTELQERVEALESALADAEISRDAYKAQVQSLARIVNQEMQRGLTCRFCSRLRTHADTCYIRESTGYDLLEEHESMLRENAELRAALAKHLPVNGKAILAGAEYKSHRDRLRTRMAKRRHA